MSSLVVLGADGGRPAVHHGRGWQGEDETAQLVRRPRLNASPAGDRALGRRAQAPLARVHEPDVHARMSTFVFAGDYVRFR
jgi:hypothetical protein